ncbi:hypothetical protein [Paenibacillus lactis]|uniref:hypothetical protein n=1 Tax=Paenibacillus lactis TaxID=228574 RepID=UPI003D74DF1D
MELKNRYEISGNELHLYLDRRNEDHLITRVDLDMFDKLKQLNVKWYAKWDKNTQGYYAQATKYMGKVDGKYKYKTMYLHKTVMNYEGKDKVDHIDHDTLNNIKANLRILKNRKNLVNRVGPNKNSTTGVRNVSYIKNTQTYRVQIQINGQKTVIGDFNTLDEAASCAEQCRELYYKI